MGRVLGSFKNSIVLLRNNPLIIGIVFAMGLLALPINAFRVLSCSAGLTRCFNPLRMVSIALSGLLLFLTGPYFTGGIFGMIREAQKGKKTSLEAFKLEGRKHYFRILIAGVIFFVILFVVTFGIAASAAAIGVLAKMGVGVSPVFVFVMMAISMALVFPVLYFFQFFDVGIVIGGYGSLQTFKESFRFVWARKLSVLGFTVLTLLIMIPMMLPGFLLSATRSTMGSPFAPLPTNIAILYVISTLFLSTIVGAVMYSYRAVYYIQARGDKIG